MSSALSSACDFKSHFCKQCGPREEQSNQGPHCLPVCKSRFEKSARIFSRRHKQTTFSDAVFLGALRVKSYVNHYPVPDVIIVIVIIIIIIIVVVVVFFIIVS